MGLMSDEILGGSSHSDDGIESDLRSTLKKKTKKLGGGKKSYLVNHQEKRAMSDHRRTVIKSSLFSALEADDSSSHDSFADDSGSGHSRTSSHGRTSSHDMTGIASQPKRRGRKSEIIASDSVSTGTAQKSNPGPPRAPKRPPSKSPRFSRKVPMRSSSMSAASSSAPRDGSGVLMMTSEREQMLLSGKGDQDKLRRRRSSNSAAPSRESEAPKSSKLSLSKPSAPKRSLSLGSSRVKSTSANGGQSAPSKPSKPAPTGQSKGMQLGTFFAQHVPSHDSDDDIDDDSMGENSMTSAQSWISWAASSALRPLEKLEKLYDGLNGIDDKRAGNEDEDEVEDTSEYPNTEAEYASTKLSTTDKIAGLRFVASKTRRRELYV